jgi:hypothetical protein
LNIDRAAEISGLIRFEQSENFKLLGLVQVQSQKTSNTKLVVNFLNFPIITHMLKYDKQRRSYDHCKLKGCCWKFWFESKEVTYRLWTLGLNEARSKGTLNIKVIGNYIDSLKRVKTQNFDIRQTKRKGLKLKGFLSYDFELESIFFKFPLVFMVCFLMQYDSMLPCNMSILYVHHQKKKLTKYIRCTYSRWQSHYPRSQF